MFKWIKNKINKKTHREHYTAIGQCDLFLTYAIHALKGNRLEKEIITKKQVLDQIIKKFRVNPLEMLEMKDASDLMKLNKECRSFYNKHFNWMGKSFDEEYTPVRIKIKGDIDSNYS